jgi:hypothetical protein
MVKPKPEPIYRIDSSAGEANNMIRAGDAGPHFTKEEWSRRLTPHIDKPLAGTETREMHIARLKRERAEVDRKIAELEAQK